MAYIVMAYIVMAYTVMADLAPSISVAMGSIGMANLAEHIRLLWRNGHSNISIYVWCCVERVGLALDKSDAYIVIADIVMA